MTCFPSTYISKLCLFKWFSSQKSKFYNRHLWLTSGVLVLWPVCGPCTRAAYGSPVCGRREIGLWPSSISECELSVWAGFKILKDSSGTLDYKHMLTSQISETQYGPQNTINKNRERHTHPPASHCYEKSSGVSQQLICKPDVLWLINWTVFLGRNVVFSAFFTFSFSYPGL